MRGGEERVYKKGGKEDEKWIGMVDRRRGSHGRAGGDYMLGCVEKRERRRKKMIWEI